MFGSQILDVAIGLILLFLLLSLVCSSIKEALETVTRYRAKDLERGIYELLNARDNQAIMAKFYDHPLIFGLFQGTYAEAKSARELPSYIPSDTFALAVLDLVKSEGEDSHLAKALTPLMRTAGDDFRRAQKNVEDWYNASMDRVSGWYKRRTQKVIAAFGFGIALAFNIDAVAVARYLNATPGVRSAWVEQARKSTSSASTPSIQDLLPLAKATDIPIGWNLPSAGAGNVAEWEALPGDWLGWILKLAGIIMTGLCVSLGAPFWFDVLNKFMVVRSTVKPEEKSQEEPSKA